MPFLTMKQCKNLMYKIKHLIRLVEKITIYKTEGKDICFILYINLIVISTSFQSQSTFTFVIVVF